MTSRSTLAALADDLAAGRTTARALVTQCLQRIADPAGEGARVFVHVDRDGALAAADAMDALRRANAAPSRFAGIPVSVKDLFDIAGQATKAGSRALDDAKPAAADAPAVARLRAAGFIVIGRTNMTEFAFSGIGINPHYGTPKSVWRRDVGHVPGGSSSGAAVSVADGMAFMGLGTDTGGSCRIPAAFNGIVGYKPTARRVPTAHAVPLSTTLDSVGPFANSVACCAAVDAILANEAPRMVTPRDVAGLRIAVPTTLALDDLDAAVATAFEAALARLTKAGAVVARIAMPAFADIAAMNAKGGFAAAESYAWHRALMARRGDDYDPRVIVRIRRGAGMDAADYIDVINARPRAIARFAATMAGFDALAMPTAAITPPAIDDLVASDDAFARANILALRNCTFINVLDGCAISLPLPGDTPVGLMLAAPGGCDDRLFDVAAGVETALQA